MIQLNGIEIPLDGSISVFPLADGTAIITKFLNNDGKSEVKIFKPVEVNEIEKTDKNVVNEQVIQELIQNALNSNLENVFKEIKTLKRQVEDLQDDVELKSSKSKK